MSTSPFPAHTAASPAATWLAALSGLATLAVAMGIGRFAFTPVLPMMLEEGALGIAAGAWLASLNYLGYLIGALSAIFIRIVPARAIRAGLATIALTTLAMALPLPFAGWAALRLAAGVASAWVLISVSAWGLESVQRHGRPWMTSVVFAGVGSGIALAGVLCIALAARGAAAAWGALGSIALLVTWLVWNRFALAAPSAPAAAPTVTSKATSAAPKRPTLTWSGDAWRLILAYGLFGFGYIIPATFLPVMARQALGGSPAFAWSWPVFGLAAALSVLGVAALVRRIGNRPLWIACHLVMAVGVALPLWSRGLTAILAAALAVGGTFMVLTLAALQEARKVAGPEATGLIAAMTAAFAAGQILGPLTIGRDGGFDVPLAIAAAALIAGAALLLRFPSPRFSSQTKEQEHE